MRSISIAVLILLAPMAGACASWSVDPTLRHQSIWAPHPSCDGTIAAENARLCNALTAGRTTASEYLETSGDLDKEHQAATAVQFASALSLAGFTAFDAHQDNRSAALILGGAATGYQSSLHPAESARVLMRGYAALRCVDLAAQPFLQDPGRAIERRRIRLASLLESGARGLPLQFSQSVAQSQANAVANSAPLYFAAGQMLQSIISRSRALSERLLRDAGAQQQADQRVNAAVEAIREYVRASLARRPPDFEGYARLLAEPPKKAEAPAQPPADPAADPPAGDGDGGSNGGEGHSVSAVSPFASRSQFNLQTVQGLIGYGVTLDTGLAALADATPSGPGEDEYAAISACVPALETPPADAGEN